MRLRARLVTSVAVAVAAMLALVYWWADRQSEAPAIFDAGTAPGTGKTQGKILYYRHPMGLPDTSPVPKKDAMGMDYIAVREGEETGAGGPGVKISPERIQKLGVRTEAVAPRELIRSVDTVATIQVDERRLYAIAPRFEGWIQRLYVNVTGQAVKKGEALMDVYSPELITAQHEYLIARKGVQDVEGGGLEARAGMERLGESALQRLRNWDISEADLRILQQENRIRQHLTLRSPVRGVVLEKPAIQGQRFMPGEMLYRIADLSTVWVLSDVFEQDLGLISEGQAASIIVDAYPDKVFNGKVAFIYPTLNPETRTARVRIELPNPHELLKPAMYGRARIASPRGRKKVLAVPASAVLHTGTRRVALVALGEGRFEPREIALGMRGDDHVEVLEGLKAGERVVVRANFMIDAESNLKAALARFDHGAHMNDEAVPGEPPGADSVPSGPLSALPRPSAAPPPVLHQGKGTVRAIDLAGGAVTLDHGPIDSLGWPAMAMDFPVAEPQLLRTLKPGEKIAFEVKKGPSGEHVIVSIRRTGTADTTGIGGNH